MIEQLFHAHWHGLALTGATALLTLVAAAVYRSLGVAGGGGIMILSRLAIGWWRYSQGDARDVVNVTLNTTRGDVLSIDTVVSDTRLLDVWQNAYHVRRILQAARECTLADPVVQFRGNGGEEGRKRRVDAYRVLYDPIVSMVAERCSNDGSIDLALGKTMRRHRFVLALTYEPIQDGRLRHLRVMMVLEDELEEIAREDREVVLARPQHAQRLATLRSIARLWRTHPDRLGVVNVWRPV